MKTSKKIIALFTLSILTNSQAATIHMLGTGSLSSPAVSPDVTTAFGTSSTQITSGSKIIGIAGNADGQAFTYDVTYTVVSGMPFGLFVTSGNFLNESNSGGGAGNRMDPGESFSITIDNISNANVTFDGFINFSIANAASGEGMNFNGQDFVQFRL